MTAVVACALAAARGVSAQAALRIEPDQLASLEWRALGPAIAGGRITDIEVHPTDRATIYIGAASGGVFRTVNRGTTWQPVFDDAANLSVGDIAIAPSSPDVVWVGTGEANNRNSSPWGQGVYRSTDAGQTWQLMGLEETRHIGRILIHPRNPDIVWVAALGHLFGPNEERGLYKTTDGGRTWRRVKQIDVNTGFVDLANEPGNPDVLYAAAYQRQRRAFGFIGGGPGSGLYRSTDGGESWRELTKGLPQGNMGRIGLAVSTRNPALVFAIVEARGGGIFRSEDRGENWMKVNDLNPRPMYYSTIRIDPGDDDRIYVLGTQLHRSEDGGKTFGIVRTEEEYGLGVHVDHHALWIDPDDSDRLLLGNDGGFYFSYDRGERWSFAANLPIQQFYDIDVDMAEPFHILGGLQDNNSYRGPSAVRRWQGIMNADWEVIDYGDGMYVASDPSDPNTAYIDSQGGAIVRVHLPTGDRKALQPVPRDTSEEYRFDWTSPIVVSRHDAATVYLGGNRLFRTRDRGDTWTQTEDLTRRIDRDTLRIMGMLADSTALSRNDGTSGYGEITTISESPISAQVLWVGTDDGNVQVSRDGGTTWSEVGGNVRGMPHRMFVSRVSASHAVEGRAYVAFDGHWDDDYHPYLYVTEDFGRSWRSLSSALPSATVNVVREHPRNPDMLVVGAEDGLLLSLDRGLSWTRITDLPRVPVDDVEIHPRDNALVVGTHGRGIWVLDDINVLSGLTASVVAQSAHLFDVPPATLFQYRNSVPPLGNAAFRAPNPAYGTQIAYWLGTPARDSVTLRVRDAGGRVVRTLRGSGATGAHRVRWDLRLDPLPDDTTDFPAPNLDVGARGPLVTAGAYSVELQAGATPMRKTFEVRTDPLMPVPLVAQQQRFAFAALLYALQREAYHAGVQANRIEKLARTRVDSLKARASVPEPTRTRADSLRGVISSAAGELRRQNNALRGWWRGLIGELDGGPSTIGTMTAPTEAQERRRVQLDQRFDAAFAELDRVVSEVVPSLNELLRQAGLAPIQVPPRPAAATTS